MPMINEAFFALMEVLHCSGLGAVGLLPPLPHFDVAATTWHARVQGVGGPADIDVGMTLGTNQPMGPLALADFIGLDTCLAVMRVLHSGLGDDKYRPCPLLVQYVDAGWVGKKSGKGVYQY